MHIHKTSGKAAHVLRHENGEIEYSETPGNSIGADGNVTLPDSKFFGDYRDATGEEIDAANGKPAEKAEEKAPAKK